MTDDDEMKATAEKLRQARPIRPTRWRVALEFEIDADDEAQAWERADMMVANDDLAMYDATFVSAKPRAPVKADG